MVARQGGVWIYLHENVPGISADRLSPWPLFKSMELSAKRARLVRYTVSRSALRQWTRRSLREMAAQR